MADTLLISIAAISMVSLLLIGLLLVRFETSYGEESRRRFAAELDAARKESDRELSRLREEFSAQIETLTNLNQMSVKNIQTDIDTLIDERQRRRDSKRGDMRLVIDQGLQ